MTTTILHVSDTHLGNRQYRSRLRSDDFAAAFDEAVDIALGDHPDYDNDPVDAVVHTGDLFDDTSPSLDDVHECQRILARLHDADIPFYAIVGNHERKMRTQFMDLYEDAGLAIRLNREPAVVGDDVALYGIDAVRRRSWDTEDFTLTEPDNEDLVRVVCMHQLFSPPIDDDFLSEYEMEPVIDRFDIDVDGVALGDYHQACRAETEDGVPVWYPGSTERCSKAEDCGTVKLLTLDADDGDDPIDERTLSLNNRQFETVKIEFGTGDTIDYVDQRLNERDAQAGLADAVVVVELHGETVPITKKQIHERLHTYDVAVARVEDKRTLTEFDDADAPDVAEVQDIDSAIDDALEDAELDDLSFTIEDIVRDDEIVKSNVENEVAMKLVSTKESMFGDRKPDAPTEDDE